MQLVNMKMTPEQQKDYATGPGGAMPEAPAYPYGLCLHLDQDSVKKLGLSVDPKMVKQDVLLTAKAYVKRVEKSADEQETRAFLDLQITDLAVELASGQKPPEDQLYGGEKEIKEPIVE